MNVHPRPFLQLQNPENEGHLRYTVVQLQVSAGTSDSLNYALQIDPEETGNYTLSLPTLPQVHW